MNNMSIKNSFIRILFLFFILLVGTHQGFAQKVVRDEIRKGNKNFNKENYHDAEVAYRKALAKNPKDTVALYNLANTLFLTERGEEAGKTYAEVIEHTHKRTPTAADVNHNGGTLLMAAKQYQEAIELFKESLRARPDDDETRYNLILAQKLLEKEKQKSQEDKQDQNEKQEQENKEEQDQQNNQQNPEQQPKDQDDDRKNKAQEQPSDSPERMSKDNAEKILKAFLEDEKKTQEKVNKAQAQQHKQRKAEKNW